jgi:hypothetical protein
MRLLLFITLTMYINLLHAQKNDSIMNLPYMEIEDYPSNNNSGAIMQRLTDGLGYRYYWATEGLTTEELNYTADNDSRSIRKTLEHIHSLASSVKSFSEGKVIQRGPSTEVLSFAELREETLLSLKGASKNFSTMSDETLYSLKVKFKRGERSSEFEMWHIVNGQISDAIYHVGQVVYNRRAAGNPVDPGMNVFMGRNRF